MSEQFLMAVDAGTGSVRAVLFRTDGTQIGCVQQEWEHREDPRYPGSMDFDWTHNWRLACGCIRGVIEETGVRPEQIAAVSRGLIKVEGGQVLILADTIERPEEIDANRARREAEEAQAAMLQKASIQSYHAAQARLARAINRLKVKGSID